MTRNFKSLIFGLLFLGIGNGAIAQPVKFVLDTINYKFTIGMWRPNSGFKLDMDKEIFKVDVNPSISPLDLTMTPPKILGISLGTYGIRLKPTFKFHVSSNFIIKDATSGHVDLTYDNKILYTLPGDSSFNKGSWVNINRQVTKLTSSEIKSYFPNIGTVKLDLKYGVGAMLEAQLCMYACSPYFKMLPVTTSSGGLLGIWPPQTKTILGFVSNPANNQFTVTYPCGFNICNNTVSTTFNYGPNNGFEFSISPPFVETLPKIVNDMCINSLGADEFMTMSLDLLDFVGSTVPATKPIIDKIKIDTTIALQNPICYLTSAINSAIPIPSWVPGVGAIMSTLNDLCTSSGKVDILTITLDVIDLDLEIGGNLNQDFKFCPEIRSVLEFPTTVGFKTNPLGPTQYSKKVNYNINLETVSFKYPCDYNFLDINRKYFINPNSQTSNFYHELFLSLEPQLVVSAMDLNLEFHDIEITPYIPIIGRKCINLLFTKLCLGPWGIPAIEVPLSSLSYDPDPLFGPITYPLPVATFPLYDADWNIYDTDTIPHDTIDKGTFRVIPARFIINELTQIDVSCFGESTGSFTATLLGGTAPYTWVIDNVVTSSSNPNLVYTQSSLNAGVHSIKVIDANGCEIYAGVTITEPISELEFLGWNTTEPSCYNFNDGKLKATVQGGTPTYQYSWDNTALTNLDSLVSISAGLHNLTIEDFKGCALDTSIVLGQPDSLGVSLISLTNINCKGDSTGTISISPFGGSPSYTFLWNTGATTFGIDSIPQGVYQITISDNHACTKDTLFTITEPVQAVTIASTVATNVSCFGGDDGKIETTITGGTPTYDYSWYNSSSILLLSDSSILENIETGTYYLKVIDYLNCHVIDTISIQQPNLPLSANSSITDVSCYDGQNGQIVTTPFGGTFPYQIVYSTGGTNTTLANLATGDYSYIITDNNLCTYEDTLFVSQPADSLSLLDSTVYDVLCFGDSTGYIWPQTQGGTPMYTFNWSTGDTTEQIENIPTGTYNLTILDANNCALNKSFFVSQPFAPISISQNVFPVSCYNGNDGGIDVVVSGGTPGYSYSWITSDSIVYSDTTHTLSNLKTGIYTVIIRDSNLCMETSSIPISQPQNPLNDSISLTSVSCFGGSDGQLVASAFGGTPPYTYLWSNAISGAVTSNLNVGLYKVTITDSKGCKKIDSSWVNQPDSPLSAVVEAKMISCFNGQDGTVLVQVNGGTSPYTNTWSNGATSDFVDGLSQGVYSVTVIDQKGCMSVSGANLTQPMSSLSIQITTVSNLCFGDSTGKAEVVINGGTPPYYINWGDSLFLMSEYANNLSSLLSGTYQARIEDENGCFVDTMFFIGQPDSLRLSLLPSHVTCFEGSDGSISLQIQGGSSPYDALWEDGPQGLVRSNLSKGKYKVKVTDNHACILAGSITITEPEDINTQALIEALTCREANDAAIEAYSNGGNGSFSYSWSNGTMGAKIENLGPGIYQVFSTDISGCKDTLIISIDESLVPCFEIPNSFSPNGDGINDTWIIDYLNLIDFVDIRVFNQQGVEVYWSNHVGFEWDGSYLNQPLPSATYYYVITTSNSETSYSGAITIIR